MDATRFSALGSEGMTFKCFYRFAPTIDSLKDTTFKAVFVIAFE